MDVLLHQSGQFLTLLPQDTLIGRQIETRLRGETQSDPRSVPERSVIKYKI